MTLKSHHCSARAGFGHASGAALRAETGNVAPATPSGYSASGASPVRRKARVQAGGTLRIAGGSNRGVRTVIFHGSEQTKSDNVKVRVNSTNTRALRVKVPLTRPPAGR